MDTKKVIPKALDGESDEWLDKELPRPPTLPVSGFRFPLCLPIAHRQNGPSRSIAQA